MGNGLFYGQQREDELLWYLLSPGTGEKFAGTFLDIGAHDGVQFSNTLAFEQAGWTGICVEPHPESFLKLIQARKPRCFNVAVGDRDIPLVDFYTTDEGMMSSLRSTYRDEGVGYYGQKAFEGWKKIQIPMYRLDTLLRIAGETSVDLVSIDVEGSENEVLAGFHPIEWKVKIVVLEIQLDKDIPKIKEWFSGQGYAHVAKLSNNHFFSNNAEDIKRVDQWHPGKD